VSSIDVGAQRYRAQHPQSPESSEGRDAAPGSKQQAHPPLSPSGLQRGAERFAGRSRPAPRRRPQQIDVIDLAELRRGLEASGLWDEFEKDRWRKLSNEVSDAIDRQRDGRQL
jgi:hypothetical protein